MKNLLLLFIVLCFVSCGEPTELEIFKGEIEKGLVENLNDPSSYEFIRLKMVDSVTLKDLEKFENSTQHLYNTFSTSTAHSAPCYKKATEFILEDIEKYKKLASENLENKEQLLVKIFSFKYRAVNNFNAKVVKTEYIYVTTDFTVLLNKEKKINFLNFDILDHCKI